MSNQLRRALTVWGAAAFVVTNMIGSGIFTVPAFVRTATGGGLAALGVWTLGGLVALSGALCYAELATRMPEAGGEYHYLSRIFGPLWGFVSGWISFFVGFSAAVAAAGLGAAAYAASVFPAWHPEAVVFSLLGLKITAGSLAAALVILAFAAFHATGVRPGGRLQTIIAASVVAAIGFFVVLGVASGRGDWRGLAATTTAQGGWGVALIQVSFAYSGWNAAGYLAGEVIDPRRTLPRALFGGTLSVTLVYLALNVLFLYALPAENWQPSIAVGAVVAQHLFGPHGAAMIAALITLIILGAVSAMTAAGPRVYYAMARDGMAPAIFGRLGRAGGAPVAAIFTQALIATALALTGAFESLLIYAGSALWLMAAMAIAGLWFLPRRADAGFRAPGYPLTPAVFVGLTIFVFAQALRERPIPSGAAVVTILAGVAIFYVLRRFGWLHQTSDFRPQTSDISSKLRRYDTRPRSEV